MIKAILLDLDDTLLRIDTDSFARNYIGTLSQYIAQCYPHVPMEAFQRAIGSASRSIMRNLDPTRQNNTLMSESIVQGTGIGADDLTALYEDFFLAYFAELGANAYPSDGAAALVDHLLGTGYMVTIATMPLFPRRAIVERLRWAGIDAEQPFKLITSLENMHFSKPSMHYYEEILARIGVEADDALMVGDSLENDLIPAAQAGLHTYWVNWQHATPNDIPDGFAPDGAGTLRDLMRCIDEGWLQSLTLKPRTAAQIAPRMLGNVAALWGLFGEIGAPSWHIRVAPDEWTPLEILCHLRDSEVTVQRAQLLRVLQETNPFLPPTPTPPRPGARKLDGVDAREVLTEFTTERAKTLDILARLSEEDWKRPARHSIFGPTTLLELAHFTARHDRLHINQLCELIGQCS